MKETRPIEFFLVFFKQSRLDFMCVTDMHMSASTPMLVWLLAEGLCSQSDHRMNPVKHFPDIYNAAIYYYSKSKDRMQTNIVIFTSLFNKQPQCLKAQCVRFSSVYRLECRLQQL